MISVTLSQLTDILNGELQGADITLDAVTTDTRLRFQSNLIT